MKKGFFRDKGKEEEHVKTAVDFFPTEVMQEHMTPEDVDKLTANYGIGTFARFDEKQVLRPEVIHEDNFGQGFVAGFAFLLIVGGVGYFVYQGYFKEVPVILSE